MNHIYLVRFAVLKRAGFQSQKYGMPTYKFWGKKEHHLLYFKDTQRAQPCLWMLLSVITREQIALEGQ